MPKKTSAVSSTRKPYKAPQRASVIWLVSFAWVFLACLFAYQKLVPEPPISVGKIPKPVAEPTLALTKGNGVVLQGPLNLISPLGLPELPRFHREPEVPTVVKHRYEIQSGDTLAKIFLRLKLPLKTMYNILEADQEYLVLEPILKGDTLTFQIDTQGKLYAISRQLDASKQVAYVRHKSGGFTYQEILTPIDYVEKLIDVSIAGSFYQSARKHGLSDANILLVQNLFNNQIQFDSEIQAGDQFKAVLRQGFVGEEQIGNSELEALELTVKGQTLQAFRNLDGHFYDQNGNGLSPSLLRWPTSKQYRISSPFNKNRLHPITGRHAPHNGVDLATPIGTKVLATGNGIVTRVANHKYAGKYLVLDNTGPYSTRFLHLSKILVNKGERVKRGQVIALSGNTGRSTGAHLHYELHFKGQAVNPMTAKIPTEQSISNDQKGLFLANVEKWQSLFK
ncbi:peptidoglycan DD-metalloendopeptidase family protein [Marinomonas epiphytica]